MLFSYAVTAIFASNFFFQRYNETIFNVVVFLYAVYLVCKCSYYRKGILLLMPLATTIYFESYYGMRELYDPITLYLKINGTVPRNEFRSPEYLETIAKNGDIVEFQRTQWLMSLIPIEMSHFGIYDKDNREIIHLYADVLGSIVIASDDYEIVAGQAHSSIADLGIPWPLTEFFQAETTSRIRVNNLERWANSLSLQRPNDHNIIIRARNALTGFGRGKPLQCRSSLTNRYNVVLQNCEHFVTCMVYGTAFSSQTQNIFDLLKNALSIFGFLWLFESFFDKFFDFLPAYYTKKKKDYIKLLLFTLAKGVACIYTVYCMSRYHIIEPKSESIVVVSMEIIVLSFLAKYFPQFMQTAMTLSDYRMVDAEDEKIVKMLLYNMKYVVILILCYTSYEQNLKYKAFSIHFVRMFLFAYNVMYKTSCAFFQVQRTAPVPTPKNIVTRNNTEPRIVFFCRVLLVSMFFVLFWTFGYKFKEAVFEQYSATISRH